MRSLLYFLIVIYLFSSCSNKKLAKADLIGNWELVSVKGENRFMAVHEKNDRPGTCKQYLVISQDSIISIEQPCFIVNTGKYSIIEDKLKIDFEQEVQMNKVSLKDNVLELTRQEDNSSNTYVYSKVNNIDTINRYRDAYNMVWDNPLCFNGTKWQYTGRKLIVCDTNENMADFNPPNVIDLDVKNKYSWCKNILKYKVHQTLIKLYAYKYNGKELQFIPDSSCFAYVYKRVK